MVGDGTIIGKAASQRSSVGQMFMKTLSKKKLIIPKSVFVEATNPTLMQCFCRSKTFFLMSIKGMHIFFSFKLS